MDNAIYVSLTRQASLFDEMQLVANNIANMSTTGFKKEGVVFSEFVRAAEVEGGSISMAGARVRSTDFSQGELTRTGSDLDVAIEGEGFFQIGTPDGIRLSRAGSFSRNADGELVNVDGNAVLGDGGSPITLPPDADVVSFASDGTLTANGAVIGKLALVVPQDPTELTRENGVLFGFTGPLRPAEEATISGGFIERGNVEPVSEMARMISVQRAYELGQKLLDGEDERIREAIRTLGRSS